ncbi:MAG: hypothetical protein KDE19_00915, partial [Caldilineaceae bacterium]|nr:hypothetical protein [Caldilineaceae bacterium]
TEEPPVAESTPTPPPTPTPIPTDTPVPTPTFTPTPAPTPYAVVESGVVSLRTGPSVEFPLAAQLGPRIPIAITGRNPEGTWYRLCCVNRNESTGNDGSVWVVSNHVTTVNDVNGVELVAVLEPPPAPTPTWTFTPTPTITPTPTATFVPFERALGPQYFNTCNPFLTIWVKLFVETFPDETPLGGYYLEVLLGEDERPSTNGTNPSAEEFSRVRVPGTGYGDLMYNLKYEYAIPTPTATSIATLQPCASTSNLPSGNWKAYVVDGEGNRLSDILEFTTNPNNTYREIYIAWKRVR